MTQEQAEQNLRDALDTLDLALTGKPKVAPNIRSQKDWMDLLHNELYLSDGGYSRVYYSTMWDDPDAWALHLSDVSIAPAKDRWEHVVAEREAVEDAFSTLINLAQ